MYAGAVGRFDFDRDEMDTCIAIRTMTCKDGVVYLQAGTSIDHAHARVGQGSHVPQVAVSSLTVLRRTSISRPSTSWAPTFDAWSKQRVSRLVS